MLNQPPVEQAAPEQDIRTIIQQLQASGQFDQLSTAQLEQLLSQLKGEPVKGLQMPNAQGISFQSEDGRQVAGNSDRTAKTADQELQTIAEIFAQMRNGN
jgi:hypothetical protein